MTQLMTTAMTSRRVSLMAYSVAVVKPKTKTQNEDLGAGDGGGAGGPRAYQYYFRANVT